MDIPVIPGISVTPMGILNKSLKDIICALLFGGLNNMLKGPLLCINLDLAALIGMPNLQQELKNELMSLQNELKSLEQSMGIGNMLGRVNSAIAEVQSLLALDGLCPIPLKAPPIPDVIGQVIDAEFAQANAILADLGRLSKPKLCLGMNGAGGFGVGTGSYNASSILGSIQNHLRTMGNIPSASLAGLLTRLRQVRVAIRKSTNRQLFPDFRHNYNLATGVTGGMSSALTKARASSGSAIVSTGSVSSSASLPSTAIMGAAYTTTDTGHTWIYTGSGPAHGFIDAGLIKGPKETPTATVTNASTGVPVTKLVLASTAEQNALIANIAASDDINLQAWQEITGMPGATTAQIIAIYPPADTPNLKDATNTAQTLVASVKKTGSYPVDVNGVRSENIWPTMLGPELYAMTVDSMTPQDPLFTQQDPVYDYCGKLVGYSSTVITGNAAAGGGDPTAGADPNPPVTNFNFMWIADRQCWAVVGVQSEQIVNGRSGMYLNANPTIELHRGYSHILGIPSMDILGNGLADEFFIYKVHADLTPDITQPFNLGLSRLETYELLADANGIPGAEGLARRTDHPLGTSLYFAAAPKVYAETTPPTSPSTLVWWHNPLTCVTQQWDGSTWTVVSQAQIDAAWVGSSTVLNAPNVNYLAYSNQSGSIFGLIRLI